jgi:signal peptidase II
VNRLKQRLSDYAFLLLIAGTIVALDQASKYLVQANLAMGEVYRPELWLSQYVRVVHLHNRGAAIGIFPGLGNVFMILAMLVSAGILYYYPRIARQDWLVRLSLALVLGGAVGNMIDRLQQGYVTDFISLLNIPVLNLADISILTGVLILFIGLWRKEQRKKPGQDNATQDHTSSSEEKTGRFLSLEKSLREARRE